MSACGARDATTTSLHDDHRAQSQVEKDLEIDTLGKTDMHPTPTPIYVI